MAISDLLTDYPMAYDQVAIGWLSAGNWMAIRWILAGYGLAMDYMYLLADHGLTMGWLQAIHHLAIS